MSERWPVFLFTLALAVALTVDLGVGLGTSVLWLLAAWHGYRIQLAVIADKERSQ